LTDGVIEKMLSGTADEQLLGYAVNRLAFLNEKEIMLKLHEAMVE
jgi:hypothetical protein